MSVARAAGAALGVAAAAGAAAFAWGALVERNRFTIRYEVVPILAPGSRPITVLHLTDAHMAPWQHAKQEWIASLRTIVEPDLVIDTGDNLGHVDGLTGVRTAFDAFRGVPGVFVHGSNDYYGPQYKNPLRYFSGPSARHDKASTLDTAALERYFTEDLDWLDLNNRARAIELRGSRIEFIGVNDAHRGWDRLDQVPGLLEELRENVGWQDDRGGTAPVTIGVTHAPYRRVLDSFVTHGAELIVAGHTHGGQVRIPGRPALVTNCDIPPEQAQGLSLWRHARRTAYLNVSAGIGTSIFAPVRFACPPEAVVLTLVGGDAPESW